MCEPTALVSMAITGASTALSFQGASEDAANHNRMAQANARNAYQSALDQQADLRIGQMQDQQADAEEMLQTAMDTRAAMATAEVAAGEAGVGGTSVRNLLREFEARQGNYNSTVRTQQAWNNQQVERNMAGLASQTQDRINSVRTVARPSFFDAALRIAGAGVGEYSDMKQRQQGNYQ